MADGTQTQQAQLPQATPGGGLSKLVLWLLVLGLLATVWWLGSERNARRFTAEARDGQLLIGRGRFFPFGSRLIDQDDGPLWNIYQPLRLPAGSKEPPDREFDEQAQLDQALFTEVLAAARQAEQKGDEASLGQADALAARASDLPGLAPSQLAELASLRGDLALTSSRSEVTAALKLVLRARARLEEARRVGGDRLPQIEALANSLDVAGSALQAAGQPTPPAVAAPPAAPQPLVPPPAPAPATTAVAPASAPATTPALPPSPSPAPAPQP